MSLLRPPEGTTRGACVGLVDRGADPWFPPVGLDRSKRQAQYAVARTVCAGCPVRYDCAVQALTDAEGQGVWGGLDPDDRREVAERFGFPRPGLPPHGTRARYVHREWPCHEACCREAHRRWADERRAAGAWERAS